MYFNKLDGSDNDRNVDDVNELSSDQVDGPLDACENQIGNFDILEKFETWLNIEDDEKMDENAYMRRQVGFCSQWCLDNLCKLVYIDFMTEFLLSDMRHIDNL